MAETVVQKPAANFEATEANTRFIALFGASTLIALVAIIFGLQWYVDRSEQQQIFVKVLEPVSEDLKALHAREDAELNSYQYIDRTKGTVRLPIDRAMQLLAQESAEGKLWYPAAPVPVPPPAAPAQTPAAPAQGGTNAAPTAASK